GRIPGGPTAPAVSRTTLPKTAPPRRRAARVLSWIAVLTSVAILATAGAGYALLNFYDGKINRIPGLDLGGGRPEGLPRDAKNILIVGSDSRGDLEAGEGPQGTGDDFVTGQRSDTVILAHLYGDSDKAQLVSFPRDSWVQIPEHTNLDSGEVVEAREAKLNTALSDGGPPLLIDTIEGLTGLHVDHYMQIDFDGFQSIVNELDGVEVCLPAAAKEKDSGIDLPAGRSVIKGDQALAFVRQRKGLPNGDIDRIKRQQQFIGAIVRKVLSAGTLLNPVKLDGVIRATAASLDVDRSLGISELKDLALRFQSFDAGGVVFTTVPVADPAGTRQRQSVVLLDEDQGQQLFDAIRRDVPPGTPEDKADPPPSEPLIVAPQSIRVRVYNGAGVQGLGRQAASDLEEVGFLVVGTPGNREGAMAETVVLHGADRADSARTVAAALPGSSTRLDPSLEGKAVEVVVGSSYAGAKEVTVSGRPQPQDPSTGASPSVQTAAQDPCAA
ncbi:MAG: cell envelope-related transcriptional attenuator, partial [Frankiales bacterium]|nr:cell envelope-related transcriptional attenuator [Frankiales bacterium]